MQLNQISGQIVQAAMRVHTALGPGLLENAYEGCLFYELQTSNIAVRRQVVLPVLYRGIEIELGYRLDLLVAEAVVVELKAVNEILPLHKAQVLSYLKLSDIKLGLLINFNVLHLKDGITRMVNKL